MMKKHFCWGENELLDAMLRSVKVPGTEEGRRAVYKTVFSAILGLAGVFFLVRALLTSPALAPGAFEPGALLPLAAFAYVIIYSAYDIFFRAKRRTRKLIAANRDALLSEVTVELTEGVFREVKQEKSREVLLGRTNTVCFGGAYVFITGNNEQRIPSLLAFFPRRIFDTEQEEQAFRDACAQHCPVKDITV